MLQKTPAKAEEFFFEQPMPEEGTALATVILR
jgi:hypothetical protein